MKLSDVAEVAQRRVLQAQAQIERSMACINDGIPLAAEQDDRRLRRRLRTKAMLAREEADAVALAIRAYSAADDGTRKRLNESGGPEAVRGSTIDFVGAAFLERGVAAARAVARVSFRDGRAQGSGFMVSERLFLTNHHVIETDAMSAQLSADFDYELDRSNRPRGASRFSFDPNTFFVTDSIDGLDYTLIAVGPRLEGNGRLGDYGHCGLSDADDKHALGEVANIVQHPDGRYKEVVLRENHLVSRLKLVLHYVADTEPGSSGSPVFNNEWQAIALHHWGGPWRQRTDARGRRLNTEVNEGIRISAIVKHLRGRAASLSSDKRALLERVLQATEGGPAPLTARGRRDLDGAVRVDPDGRVTWSVPIEVSVRFPSLVEREPVELPLPLAASSPAAQPGGESRIRPSTDYDGRSGYKPDFIEGFNLPLPQLSDEQQGHAAPNMEAGAGDDPFELKYHHFSVVMNRSRRLAFFTACNIDGSTSKHVDRDTGAVTVLQPDDVRLERLLAEGAEASENWFDDERLEPSDYAGKDIYEGQRVPGHPDTRSMGRTLRMFQRGHLVRRMDPAWGTKRQALLADADTFHWTNCSPQVGFFNMGRAAPSTPNSARGQLWRAIENYVLRNAVAERARVSCFTGPVFTTQDRRFRDIRVPGRFWKVVVWAERGELCSVAMIADQRPVIDAWPESVGEGLEAYGDPDELSRVEDFLTTVAEVEELTKLDFGEEIRAADVNGQRESRRILRFEEVPLRREGRKRTNRARAASVTRAKPKPEARSQSAKK
jgi:endonuclease G